MRSKFSFLSDQNLSKRVQAVEKGPRDPTPKL